MRCPNCNRTIPDDSEFCQYCGHELKLVCPKCGADLDDDSDFCKKCGKKIKKKSINKKKTTPIHIKLSADEIYDEAILLKSKNNIKNLKSAIDKFSSIPDYEDSEEHKLNCLSAIKTLKAKRRKRIILSIAGILTVVLISFAVFAVINWIVPEIKYNNAKERFESADFDTAKTLFSELDNYKDSKDMVKKTDLQKKYNDGLIKLEKGEYNEAADIFNSIINYSNSRDMYLESLYYQFKSYVDQKRYYVAIMKYDEIVEIQPLYDKHEINKTLSEVRLKYIDELIDKECYEDAASQYEKLRDTDNEKYKECCYRAGEKRYDKGLDEENNNPTKDLKYAINLFTNAGDYKDSKTMADECKYQYVKKSKTYGFYAPNGFYIEDSIVSEYIKYLKEIDYKDSREIFL